MARQRELAAARTAAEMQAEVRAKARLVSEQALAAAGKEKLGEEQAALSLAAERARIETEAASIAKQRRADSARRAELASERSKHALARVGARLRRISTPAMLAATAFTLGIGAGALWQKTAPLEGEESSRGPVATQPRSYTANPVSGHAPGLRLDADHAGFAARAAARSRKPR
jgi:hypothetical protein